MAIQYMQVYSRLAFSSVYTQAYAGLTKRVG